MKVSRMLAILAGLAYMGNGYPETCYEPRYCWEEFCGQCTLNIVNSTSETMRVSSSSGVVFSTAPGTTINVQQSIENPKWSSGTSSNCNNYTSSHTYITNVELVGTDGKVKANFSQSYQVGCGMEYDQGSEITRYWMGYLDPKMPPTCVTGCTGYTTSYSKSSQTKTDDNGVKYYNALTFTITGP